VLLPQAVRIMLPSLISQLVVLLKDTSLGFVIGFEELLRTGASRRDAGAQQRRSRSTSSSRSSTSSSTSRSAGSRAGSRAGSARSSAAASPAADVETGTLVTRAAVPADPGTPRTRAGLGSSDVRGR
jgi:hypothetical protein